MKEIGQQFVLHGKVYIETPAGPVEIKRVVYKEEPPVLEQCSRCSQAVIYEAKPDPSTCEIAKDVRTEFVSCRFAIGRPYEPGICNAYKSGIPKRPESLLRKTQSGEAYKNPFYPWQEDIALP